MNEQGIVMNLREFYEQNPKLFHISHSVRYPGLRVVKYNRSVFYNNLWHVSDHLLESRGLVVDQDWNVVVKPFTKIFNRGENGTDIDRDEKVVSIRKVNGFMAAATYVPQFDEVVVSTTGSLDSDFVGMAEDYIDGHVKGVIEEFTKDNPTTFLFEIVHPNDPHIIKESYGAYLLGSRSITDDSYYLSNESSEQNLDLMAREMGVNRPDWSVCRFSDVVREVKNVKHEGFVVYSKDKALKIKSPYYLTAKFLARLRAEMLLSMEYKSIYQKIDEEFYPLVDYIWSDKKKFANLSEQGRITFVEEWFNGE